MKFNQLSPPYLAMQLKLVIITLLLAQPSMSVSAQAPYGNPVIGNPQRVEREIADPFVLKWNSEYYLYCTGNPITAYHSTDLVAWDFIGPVLAASERPDAWNQADVWAPEVVYRNGKFYMYYTASKRSDDWRVGEMARRIGVAVSASPRGPFIDSGQPVTPGWGIDPTVFKDPDGGEEYLFYSYLYEPRLPGAGIVADRLAAWNAVAGRPSHVTRGSEVWEDKDGDPNNGSLRYTNEGPTVLKHHGTYYMMYSGGSWDLPTYSLAYATSDKVIQGGLDGPGWRKFVPPILHSTASVEAPGHNSMVKAPNNVDDICVYHARVVPFLDPWNRLPFVDRLYWNRDRMFMRQPTLADLPRPERPLFADNFNRAGPLGGPWQTSGGQWRVVDNQLRQNKVTSGMAAAIPHVETLSNYLFEANLREAETNPAAGSRIGIAAYYADSKNHIDVWLDGGRRALLTTGEINGLAVPEQASDLPVQFKFDAYHQIIVIKNASQISVALDGINMQSRIFELGSRPGAIALQTRGTRADFDGIALTPYFEDTFDGPLVTWTTRSGTWLAEEGALHQVSGGAGRAVALKGDATESYEFNASVRWRDNESVAAKAGVIAAATDADEIVLGGFDRNIWPLARFWVQRVVKGEVQESFGVRLPRGFDYDAYHTIRVVKQGSAFTFFLDGKETAAARFEIGVARPGLFTEGVRAAFDDCAMKRIIVPENLVLNAGFETEQWDGGAATTDNPWVLSGRARANDCCAHSGLRRLIITGGDGTAKQVVTGLGAGRYTLHAWVVTQGGADSQITVTGDDGGEVRVPAVGDKWARVSAEFTVPEGQRSVAITFAAHIPAGSTQFAAADDFYLFKNE